ncbi:SOS response-associated peptidase [Phototrophicus methaneseepsis]|uniref:Abasic site processing protein n=1 Tax=Phototrophicus methaneseepsis TaxID=2710758 RepID=A0A7S8E5E7_9CHLR|nr:SOS response-associated peptidase [Phototrophicus methaneseepsis]QPC80692.1 SOS response-associated peptidase [Phototrophicus methaneseepsis]
MCGRYVLNATPEQLQKAFDLDNVPRLEPRYNIAPTQPVPIITDASPKELTLVQWGLVPSWSKDPSIGGRMFNARAETAAEKPSFRNAFKRRRCLIPATGFYEWRKEGKTKKPQYIHMKDNSIFAFAGLWEVWTDPEGGELWSCTILTGEPNDLIEPLHNRMAVILEQGDYDTWLDQDAPTEALTEVLQPYPSEEMAYYEVATTVNSYRNEGAELIEPLNPPEQQSLL